MKQTKHSRNTLKLRASYLTVQRVAQYMECLQVEPQHPTTDQQTTRADMSYNICVQIVLKCDFKILRDYQTKNQQNAQVLCIALHSPTCFGPTGPSSGCHLLQNTLVSKCAGPIYKYLQCYGVRAEYMLRVKNVKMSDMPCVSVCVLFGVQVVSPLSLSWTDLMTNSTEQNPS